MKRLAVLLALICVGCANSPLVSACSSNRVEATLKPLNDADVKFQDAVTLAENTPRMSLNQPIAELQTIRRDTAALEMPECAQPTQAKLVAYMDAEIDSLVYFMGHTDDSDQGTINSKMMNAQQARLDWMQVALELTGEITPIPTEAP